MRAVKVVGVVVAMVVASLLAGGTASAATAGPVALPAAAPAATADEEPDEDESEAAPAPPAPAMAPGTPCLATARACVDLRANRAWLIRDGVVAYGPVPITHGRKGYATPPGTFRVTFKNRDHVSSQYGAAMPYSVFFNGGIAFHQGSLKQKSHGCIHLSRTAARTFFGALARGEVVQVV